MICAPNTYRPGVVGGFVIEPLAKLLPISFTPNSTWINVGGATSGWAPALGERIEFILGDNYSGMPMVAGSSFNYRGPWAINTAYSVNDSFVWYDSNGVLQTWLVTTAYTSGPTFSQQNSAGTTVLKQIALRGLWATGTVYAAGDLALALDGSGNMQTWMALSSFTAAGSSFVQGTLWGGCLAASTVFYVVAVSGGAIQISTVAGGAALTFMSGGFFISPDNGANLSAWFGVTAFGAGQGLVAALTVGALWANGTPWIPASAPALPAAPASRISYLAYNSTTGLYWTTNQNGNTAGDAVLGWVVTNATDILASSSQNIDVGADTSAADFAGSIGPLPVTAASIPVPPTPICGIEAAGAGVVTFDAITFTSGADASDVVSAIIVLLYQDQTAAAIAHLTAAYANTATTGEAATLDTDTDLTGIVNDGAWLLVGGEMMYVTADAASANLAVERALGLTTAENHAIGDPVYLLDTATFTYSFPPLFFETNNAAGWGPTEPLPHAGIALFNIVVFNSEGGESAENPINYSQATGGLEQTGVASSSSFLAKAIAGITSGQATLDFTSARSMQVTLTAPTQVSPINTTGLAPFLWVLAVYQDSAGFHPMIPTGGLTVELATEQSPPNTFVVGLFYFDGNGNHILLSSTGDQPIP